MQFMHAGYACMVGACRSIGGALADTDMDGNHTYYTGRASLVRVQS